MAVKKKRDNQEVACNNPDEEAASVVDQPLQAYTDRSMKIGHDGYPEIDPHESIESYNERLRIFLSRFEPNIMKRARAIEAVVLMAYIRHVQVGELPKTFVFYHPKTKVLVGTYEVIEQLQKKPSAIYKQMEPLIVQAFHQGKTYWYRTGVNLFKNGKAIEFMDFFNKSFGVDDERERFKKKTSAFIDVDDTV